MRTRTAPFVFELRFCFLPAYFLLSLYLALLTHVLRIAREVRLITTIDEFADGANEILCRTWTCYWVRADSGLVSDLPRNMEISDRLGGPTDLRRYTLFIAYLQKSIFQPHRQYTISSLLSILICG